MECRNMCDVTRGWFFGTSILPLFPRRDCRGIHLHPVRHVGAGADENDDNGQRVLLPVVEVPLRFAEDVAGWCVVGSGLGHR